VIWSTFGFGLWTQVEQRVRLSSMADYAIVVMAAAARQCGRQRISSGEIAVRTGIPAPTVQKLVSRLTAAGLLRSVRGAGGGLHLARPAAAISVADIVEAVEGPIALTSCVSGGARHDCLLEQGCSMKPHWPAVNDALRGALASVTLAGLTQTPAKILVAEGAAA
jgi:FeS assembly SUF system regulator